MIMGLRIGYRIRSGDETSAILRKQWKNYAIDRIVFGTAKTLMTCFVIRGEKPIGSGLCALRSDLDIGRLSAAMYHTVYSPPFDSIETDPLGCDISDNGLFEIELVEWDHWQINHYEIGFDDETLSDPELVAEVRFTEDKPLFEGIDFKEVV